MTLTLQGKNVLVLGLGKSGLAATKFLHRKGAKVTISDIQTEDNLKEELKTIAGCYENSEFGRHNLKDLGSTCCSKRISVRF